MATDGWLKSQIFEGTARESPRKHPDSSEDSDLVNTGEATPPFSCRQYVAAGAEQGFLLSVATMETADFRVEMAQL